MSPNSTSPVPSGVLPIYKPAGVTSHDVVAQVRRVLGKQKVGHTGTLDPFATGLLLIVIGSTTRLVEYAHAVNKTYETCVTLGATSDTDDLTGVVVPQAATAPTQATIEGVLPAFCGSIAQLPPWYAAVKVGGKKLYEYARAGESGAAENVRKPRQVYIESITILEYRYPELKLRVTCGAGTYIRALGRDIGEALHTGGYLSALQRTRIGSIDISQAVAVADLTPDTWQKHLLPTTMLLAHLPRFILPAGNVAQWRQGRAIDQVSPLLPGGPIAVFNEAEELQGIGQYEATTGRLLPHKVLEASQPASTAGPPAGG